MLEPKNILKIGSFFFLMIIAFQNTAFGQIPTIQICGDDQDFHINSPMFEVCVNIDIEPGTAPIDFFEIDWDDGTPNEVIPFENGIPNINHVYDLTNFYNDCDYEMDDFGIFLFTHFIDGEEDNSGFIPSFFNFPRASFSPNPQLACVGEEICFNNTSCPTANLMVLSWDFGDGTPLTTENKHIYDAPGFYDVELIVENPCGTNSIMQTIEVILPATAEGNVLSGVVNSNQNDPYIVCLDGGQTTVILEAGTASENENSYLWEVIDGTNYTWIIDNPDIDFPVTDTATIVFSGEDLITIVLETNNGCDQPAFDTLYFEIIGGGVSLPPQADACVELSYIPGNYDEGWAYSVNGIEVDDFPQTYGPDTYVVTVSGVSAFCDNPTLTDTFTVFAESTAFIESPQADTICTLDGEIVLTATPNGGTWLINGTVIGQSNPLSFDPNEYSAGTYNIVYGNECITDDEIMLTIITADIVMPPNQEVCLDEQPVTFTASPDNGIWSGLGISDDGVFDPMITGVGDFTLYYQVQNPSLQSCSNLDSFLVTVTQLAVDFQVTNCVGTELCFETINTSLYDNICWFFDGNGPFSQDEPCYDFQTAGVHEVEVTIKRGECTATSTMTITIEDAPTAAFNLIYDSDGCSDLAVIFENNSIGNNLNYEWYLNEQLFSISETPDTVLTAYAQDTIHTITLIVSNACAEDSQTETVLVRPQPVMIFGIAENEICSMDTIEMVNNSFGNIDTWEWLLDGVTISTDSIEPVISIISEVIDTVEVCLIATNECGTDTLCYEVIITPTDVNAFFNVPSTTVCIGDTLWFSNFSTFGVPVFYQFGDGNSTAEPNPFYIYNTAGTFTVTLQAFGCGSDIFENEITVLESPLASWNNPGPACPGTVLTFTNTTPNSMNFQWDFGDDQNSVLENPSHSFDNSGVYQVCLTISDIDIPECNHTTCDFVEIFALPVADFIVTDSLCVGDETQFTNNSENAVQCLYDFGDDNTSVSCNPTHTYQNSGLYNVTLVVENGNFCPDTILKQIFVRQLPSPDFSFNLMNSCNPDTVQFNNLTPNADSYFWEFGDGMTSVLSSPLHIYDNPGTYQVKLSATTDGICEVEIVQTIIIEETPVAIFSTDSPSICANLPVQFFNNSTGFFSNTQWSFGDGTFSFEDNPTHTFDSPGTYLVELLVENNPASCSDIIVFEYTVHEPIDAVLATTDILCYDESTGSIDLTILSGTEPFEFSWSNGIQVSNPNNLPAGNYEVTLTDLNGCEWINQVELTEPEPLEAEANIEMISCFGGSDGSIDIDISGGVAPYSIIWDTGETTETIIDLSFGDYSLTITDANNCNLETTIQLIEIQPIEYLDSISHISCFGAHDGIIEFDSLFGGVSPYSVFISSDNYEMGGINTTRFDSLDAGIYSIEIEDINGCFIQIETEILEPSPISVDASVDNFSQDSVEIILGETVEITTFYNADNPVFLWSSAIDLSCSDCPDPIGEMKDSRVYILKMTDENDCIASDTLNISVLFNNDIWLPDAFEPDNQVKNNIFRIRSNFAVSVERIEYFQVFDPWGEMVWEAKGFLPNNPDFGWDGRFKGNKMPPGMYVYRAGILFKNNEYSNLEGEVLLLR